MEPFASRRRTLLDAIAPGVAVFPAAPVAIRNNDVEHEYRQDSDVFYLTGFDEPEAVVVLVADESSQKTVLFVRPRDRERETWDGLRAGVEGAVQTYGADEAYPIAELAQRLPELLKNKRRLYYRLGRDRTFDDRILAAVATTRSKARFGVSWPTEVVDPATIVHEHRAIKSDHELTLMRRAAEITRDGHVAAMRFAKPGRFEYEVEAVLRDAFRRNGSERHAYAPIVGGGVNATILHYHTNNARLDDGALLLIDAGCEYAYYACDVTRTFPVSGKFTAPQRALYEIVLDAQLASIARSRAGETLDDIHRTSLEVLVRGLLRLGLLQGEAERIMEEGSYKRFYMHRTSHYLGMDVHDVGAYYAHQKPRPLEPGMVITIEPGLYVAADDATVPAEYRGIGIRIEDDVVITAGDPEVMTADIPKTVDDVERTCAA